MVKDARYEGSGEVRAFWHLMHGAKVLLGMANKQEDGSYYTIMGGLVLTAFGFEAYLNHVGETLIQFWEDIEKIKVRGKYSVLCKVLHIKPDYSSRPHQTLTVLFDFRNSIAHGRTETIDKIDDVDSSLPFYNLMPKTKWEEFCTLDNAQRAYDDTKKIITELHRKANLGEGDNPFLSSGISTASISPRS
jgi:hypothetical protein